MLRFIGSKNNENSSQNNDSVASNTGLAKSGLLAAPVMLSVLSSNCQPAVINKCSHPGVRFLTRGRVAMELLGYLILVAGCAIVAGIFALPAMQLIAQKLWRTR
jgi:hypothetical protein